MYLELEEMANLGFRNLPMQTANSACIIIINSNIRPRPLPRSPLAL